MGFLKVFQIWFLTSSASELESSLISFAGSDSTSASTSEFTVMGIPADKMARAWGGKWEAGNYLRKAII